MNGVKMERRNWEDLKMILICIWGLYGNFYTKPTHDGTVCQRAKKKSLKISATRNFESYRAHEFFFFLLPVWFPFSVFFLFFSNLSILS